MEKIVEIALISLTGRVYLSTNLTHPSDKGAAVGLFRILRDNGTKFDPDEVRRWAIQNGWKTKGANKLREIANGILEGKRLRGGQSSWASDIFEQWKSECLEE